MDVSVANLSAGQRTFEKTKEKTKNVLGNTAKVGAGVAATIGVGMLGATVDTFDLKNAKGVKGKALSKLTKGFENVYDSMTTLFKKMFKDIDFAEIKNLPKASKGALIATVATGAACILNSIIASTKMKEKSNQIEQKYN